MPLITHVNLVCSFMPDMVEVWVNERCIYRAHGDNDTIMTAQRLKFYYLKIGDAQREVTHG